MFEKVTTYPEGENTMDFFTEIGDKISNFAGKVKNILGFGQTLSREEVYSLYQEILEDVKTGKNLGTIKRQIQGKYGRDFFEKNIPYKWTRKLESIAVEQSIKRMTEKGLNGTSLISLTNLISNDFFFGDLHIINPRHKEDIIREYRTKARMYVTLKLKAGDFDFSNENTNLLRILKEFCETFNLNSSTEIRQKLLKPLQRIIKKYMDEMKNKENPELTRERIMGYVSILGFK